MASPLELPNWNRGNDFALRERFVNFALLDYGSGCPHSQLGLVSVRAMRVRTLFVTLTPGGHVPVLELSEKSTRATFF